LLKLLSQRSTALNKVSAPAPSCRAQSLPGSSAPCGPRKFRGSCPRSGCMATRLPARGLSRCGRAIAHGRVAATCHLLPCYNARSPRRYRRPHRATSRHRRRKCICNQSHRCAARPMSAFVRSSGGRCLSTRLHRGSYGSRNIPYA